MKHLCYNTNIREEKYLIKAAHEFEKATIEKYIPRITEYLEKRGFDIDIDVVLSLEERENIKNTINNDWNFNSRRKN